MAVLAFLYAAVIAALVVAALAPAAFEGVPAEERFAFLAALIAVVALMSVGVWRRWRWLFWLIVVAFLAGILRLPATVIELEGVVPRSGPDWYPGLQAAVGVLQFVIGVLLVRGYRKAGVWGAF